MNRGEGGYKLSHVYDISPTTQGPRDQPLSVTTTGVSSCPANFIRFYKKIRNSFFLSSNMFLGYASPKLCISVNAIVVNLCKITEPRKMQLGLKVKILHNIKEI